MPDPPPSLVMVNAITQRIDHYTREESEEPLVQAARKAIKDPEHYLAAWPLGPDGWMVEIDIPLTVTPPDVVFRVILNHATATVCTLHRRGILCSDGAPALIVRIPLPLPRIIPRYSELVPLERAVAWALLEG